MLTYSNKDIEVDLEEGRGVYCGSRIRTRPEGEVGGVIGWNRWGKEGG